MQGLVSVNGVVTPPSAAKVPALDRGFLYGDAVFETLVAFRGPEGPKILSLGQHLARLRASAETLGFEVPWTDAQLEFELTGLVEEVGAQKTVVRMTVSRLRAKLGDLRQDGGMFGALPGLAKRVVAGEWDVYRAADELIAELTA